MIGIKKHVNVVPKQYPILNGVDGSSISRRNCDPARIVTLPPVLFVGQRKYMCCLKAHPVILIGIDCHFPRYDASRVSFTDSIME